MAMFTPDLVDTDENPDTAGGEDYGSDSGHESISDFDINPGEEGQAQCTATGQKLKLLKSGDEQSSKDYTFPDIQGSLGHELVQKNEKVQKIRDEDAHTTSEQKASEACEELKEEFNILAWPGYTYVSQTLVLVAFSKEYIKQFPTEFRGFPVILRTDLDNAIVRERGYGLSSEDLLACNRIIKKYGPDLMNIHANLSMIMASPVRYVDKEKNALPHLCIALYCRGKGIIPIYEKKFPEELDGISVDVREGYCYFGMRNEHLPRSQDFQQNLRIGAEIKGSKYTGTLGGFIDFVSGKVGFLTCAHVVIPGECIMSQFANSEFDFDNCCKQWCRHANYVYQPGTASSCPPVGKVKRAKFTFNNPSSTSVDAALVKIRDQQRKPIDGYMTYQDPNTCNLRKSGYSSNNPPQYVNGKILKKTDDPMIGHMVIKCGAQTGLTPGLLAMDGAIFRMESAEMRLPGIAGSHRYYNQRMIMYGQYLVDSTFRLQFFASGDSGSFVFARNNRRELCCIGIAIGQTTDGGGCIITPIEAVLDSLKIQLPPRADPFKKFPNDRSSSSETHTSDDDSDSDRGGKGGRKRKRHKRFDETDRDLSGKLNALSLSDTPTASGYSFLVTHNQGVTSMRSTGSCKSFSYSIEDQYLSCSYAQKVKLPIRSNQIEKKEVENKPESAVTEEPRQEPKLYAFLAYLLTCTFEVCFFFFHNQEELLIYRLRTSIQNN